jgi:hypothetical protein
LLIFFFFFVLSPKKILQISTYEKEIEEMKHMTRQEYIAYLRRYINYLTHSKFYFTTSHVLKDCTTRNEALLCWLTYHMHMIVSLQE